MRETRFEVSLPSRGGTIAGWHFAPEGDEERPRDRLLFLHANGFTGSTYRQFLSSIVRHQGDRLEIYAPDMRGHGLTSLPTDPSNFRNWLIYAEDAKALLGALPASEGRVFLAGHSLGAVTSINLAAFMPGQISSLTLIDPVIFPPAIRRVLRWISNSPFHQKAMKRVPIVKMAKGRRRQFASREAALENLSKKKLFANVPLQVMSDYLEDGLRKSDGGMALSCAPEWEAANFAAQGHDVFKSWRQLQAQGGIATQLYYAEKGSTTHMRVRAKFAQDGAKAQSLVRTTHLLPLESPDSLGALVAFPSE